MDGIAIGIQDGNLDSQLVGGFDGVGSLHSLVFVLASKGHRKVKLLHSDLVCHANEKSTDPRSPGALSLLWVTPRDHARNRNHSVVELREFLGGPSWGLYLKPASANSALAAAAGAIWASVIFVSLDHPVRRLSSRFCAARPPHARAGPQSAVRHSTLVCTPSEPK